MTLGRRLEFSRQGLEYGVDQYTAVKDVAILVACAMGSTRSGCNEAPNPLVQM